MNNEDFIPDDSMWFNKKKMIVERWNWLMGLWRVSSTCTFILAHALLGKIQSLRKQPRLRATRLDDVAVFFSSFSPYGIRDFGEPSYSNINNEADWKNIISVE